ncbi:MAG TPA: hypothetical protein V6D11_01220 [Waterburya sp.]
MKSFSSRLETTFAISQGFEPLAGEYVTQKLSTDSYQFRVSYPLFRQPIKLCRDVPAERLYD